MRGRLLAGGFSPRGAVLREMTTGLFLGAGASFELGMPLLQDLTNELLAWLTPEKFRELNAARRALWRQGAGFPDAVEEDFAAILKRPGMHYESILGHVQTQFMRPGPHKQEYHHLYSWLVELVYYLLYLRHVKNEEFISAGLRYFEGIIGLATMHQPLWIFSLNHDLMIECLAIHYGVPVNAGFEDSIMLPVKRQSQGSQEGLAVEVVSGERFGRLGLPFAAPGTRAINLLKIHGALDVFTFRDGKDLLKLRPLEPSVHGVLAALKRVNEELPGLDTVSKATNEIIYLDEAGTIQFLRRSLLAGAFKFDRRFGQVLPALMLQHVRSHLDAVRNLICIGYGFGDAHINDILRHWLEFDAGRRMEIVSPAASAVPAMLLHLTPQVTLHAMPASRYLSQFAFTPLTASERAMAAVRALARDRTRKQQGFA
jgi:hypothetical protein